MKNLIRLTLSMIFTSVLLAGCNGSAPANGNAPAGDSASSDGIASSKGADSQQDTKDEDTAASYEIKEEKYPLYFGSAGDKSEISLYFADGGDIPYISLTDASVLLNRSNREAELYELSFDEDKDTAVFTRKGTKYNADFDFTNDTVSFLDYDAFLRYEGSTLIDVFDPEATTVTKQAFKQKYAYERYGKEMTFDLASYDIDFVREGDGWYIPLQTFSDLILSHYGEFTLFNRECVIVADGELDEDLNEIYRSPKEPASEEMAQFSYNELCFALDHLYGLKEIHDIDSFDEYFHEAGLKKRLMGTDSVSADAALCEMINYGLDDLHSVYMAHSYSTDEEELQKNLPGYGPWKIKFEEAIELFGAARAEAYPDGIPPYEEVGNTAYITFDHFTEPDENIDYLSEPKEEELYDTIRLIQYSCDQILREDSPVENVVMDLSNNTGGYADAAAYVIASFLGRGQTDTKDMLTGAMVTSQFVIDTNRDGEFDMDDTIALKGYNLYCLTSPVSFSCGNFVPNVFKTSPYVTLLGQTSGGGSCAIMTLSNARGSVFRVSSNYRLSIMKNGSFYDIDRGADPDHYIAKVSDFYDRKALTEYINNIF